MTGSSGSSDRPPESELAAAATNTGWDVELPQSMDAPAYARLQIRNCLQGWPSDAINDALVVTSELVSNALLHGAPKVRMSVHLEPSRVTVRVSDRGPALPGTDVSAPDRDSRGGRGLLIVDALAARWGVDPRPEGGGKEVWFTLDRGTNNAG